MKITALIHTRDEEVNLPDCLRSVAWADEVAVADMASTDRTREIALAAGARVIDVPVASIVERVRNQANSQCRGDWILAVDADERVAPGLVPRLRELAERGEAEAYGIPRRNYFLGVWMEHAFWPDHQIRFFRKGKVTWSDEVHEPPRVDGRLVMLPADPAAVLEHPGYGSDLGKMMEKHTRYSKLDAQRLAAGFKPPVWPYMFRRPLGEFYQRYFPGGAWRHGMHGLVWCLFMAIYQLQIALHYWAMNRDAPGAQIEPAQLRRKVRWEALRSAAKWLRP